MSIGRWTAAVATTASFAALMLAGTAGTAHAGIPGIARADIRIVPVVVSGQTVAFDVYATGSVDDGAYSGIGQWAYLIVGERSNGGSFVYPRVVVPGATFSDYVRVTKDSAASGQLTIQLTFADTALDVTTYATGAISWQRLLNDIYVSNGV